MSQLNMGNLDRALRVLLGLALLASAVTGTIGVWGYLGIVPLLTGIVAFCPVYRLLGIRSASR